MSKNVLIESLGINATIVPNIVDLERQRVDAAELQRELKLSSGAAAAIGAREKSVADIVAEEKVAA